MAAEPKIGDFLIRLSEQPELLESYFTNPKAVVAAGSGLSEEQQEIVLSDDPAETLTALQREYPELGFESEAWKPIRFPLPRPIRRPIRRVEY